MNHQEHGQSQEGEAVRVRGSEEKHDVYSYTHGSEALSGVSGGVGCQFLTLDREDSAARIGDLDPFGGVIDQLIDDARKQLVKSQECIVWYRAEAQEYEEKLNNLIKLKELQQQQQQRQQQQQQLQQQQQQQQIDQDDEVSLEE